MHLKLFKTIIKKKSGFTLIELSMVLVIVGTLFSSGLIAYQSILSSSRTKITNENIDVVYKAIGNYLIANRKLPCPASLILTESDPNYGTSMTDDGTCSIGAGNPGGVITSSAFSNLVYGMVPVKTLGLPNSFAKDGFNTKISYIVDKNFTVVVNSTGTSGFEGYNPASANITIKELSASGSDIITDAIMVILSHGTNKLGGFNASSTSQNSNPTSADELDNIRTANFNNIFVINSTDTLFDDVLSFKNKMQLAIDAGFENMICREADSNYLVETPNANNTYNTNKCYDDNTITISLTWASANYGENKMPKNNDPCPVACQYNSNPTDYDNNATTNHPLRRCGKYGKWDKVVYLCSKTGGGGGGGTIINNVGVYTRFIADSPTAADSSTWWSSNGASWSLAQKTAVSNLQQISVGLTTNDALGTGANTDTIMIDLGLTKSCTKLYYRSTGASTPGGWGANSYSTGLKLSYWNGSSWIDLLTFPTFSADYDVYEPTFTSTSARYWRLLKGSGGWPSATRFQMFCN